MIIESDAFGLYWGRVLKAKGTDNIKRIIWYASGKFFSPNTRYPTHEKEVLAVKKCTNRFRLFIISQEFTLRTVSKYLTSFYKIIFKG